MGAAFREYQGKDSRSATILDMLRGVGAPTAEDMLRRVARDLGEGSANALRARLGYAVHANEENSRRAVGLCIEVFEYTGDAKASEISAMAVAGLRTMPVSLTGKAALFLYDIARKTKDPSSVINSAECIISFGNVTPLITMALARAESIRRLQNPKIVESVVRTAHRFRDDKVEMAAFLKCAGIIAATGNGDAEREYVDIAIIAREKGIPLMDSIVPAMAYVADHFTEGTNDGQDILTCAVRLLMRIMEDGEAVRGVESVLRKIVGSGPGKGTETAETVRDTKGLLDALGSKDIERDHAKALARETRLLAVRVEDIETVYKVAGLLNALGNNAEVALKAIKIANFMMRKGGSDGDVARVFSTAAEYSKWPNLAMGLFSSLEKVTERAKNPMEVDRAMDVLTGKG